MLLLKLSHKVTITLLTNRFLGSLGCDRAEAQG
jgi:hypothetical protein